MSPQVTTRIVYYDTTTFATSIALNEKKNTGTTRTVGRNISLEGWICSCNCAWPGGNLL